MTSTFTRTSVQYSVKPEQMAVKAVLNKSNFIGTVVTNDDRLRSLTDLAGIARIELNNQEQLGKHANMVDAHYDDFGGGLRRPWK